MTGFGPRLRDLRETRGLDRADLARLVGVAQNTIYNWEKREKLTRPTTIARLARALATSKEYLLYGTESLPKADSIYYILTDAKRTIADALQIDIALVNLRLEIQA